MEPATPCPTYIRKYRRSAAAHCARLQRDLIVAEGEHSLLKFRPPLKRFLHQRLLRLGFFGNLLEADTIGGNHRRGGKRRIVQVAGDGLLMICC